MTVFPEQRRTSSPRQCLPAKPYIRLTFQSMVRIDIRMNEGKGTFCRWRDINVTNSMGRLRNHLNRAAIGIQRRRGPGTNPHRPRRPVLQRMQLLVFMVTSNWDHIRFGRKANRSLQKATGVRSAINQILMQDHNVCWRNINLRDLSVQCGTATRLPSVLAEKMGIRSDLCHRSFAARIRRTS